MKKKLALALLIGLSFFVLPQQVSANEIPPSLTYESLDKTTIRLFIQNSNSNREHRICPSILNKQNLDGSWSCHEALKLYSGQGLTYDYKLSYGNTDGFNVNSYDISTKQWSGWSVWHHFTNTNPNEPIVVLPTTTTVPPTTVPASVPSSAATSYGLPLVGTTGSICSDGWHSPSTGSGTCSWHGGIKEQYAPVIIKYTPITPIIIKPIKLPSSWFPKAKCYISCG